MKEKRRGSLARQIFTGCIVFVVSLCLIMGIMSFFLLRDNLLKQYRSKITDVIELTMARIDTEDLEQCINTREATDEFNELITFLDQIRLAGNLDYIVIVRPVKEGENYDVLMVASGLLEEERYGDVRINNTDLPLLGDMIGSSYTPEFIEESYDNMINRRDIEFSTSSTDYGTTFSGSVSLRNSSGEGIAILSAGFAVENISSAMTQYISTIAIGAAVVAAVFLIFINLWLRKRVIRPIKTIETAADEFAKKSHEQKDPSKLVLDMPKINSNNELESLSETLVRLSENMKKYVEDIVFSEKEITRIQEFAFKDGLTGVSNKTAYNREIARINEAIALGSAEFGIVVVDLNSLKGINDSYGHGKGDAYIINSCRFICDVFDHSPVYRVGGDEFIIIIRNRDLEAIDELTEKLRDGMQRMRSDTSLEPWEKVWAAWGVAIYDSSTDGDANAVATRADAKMYEQKRFMKSRP